MKQMCKKKFQSPWVCRNELSNSRWLTVSVNSAEPRLQPTVRQLGLESSIRHTQGWLTLIILDMLSSFILLLNSVMYDIIQHLPTQN